MAGVDDIIKQWVERVERTGELRSIDGFGKPLVPSLAPRHPRGQAHA